MQIARGQEPEPRGPLARSSGLCTTHVPTRHNCFLTTKTTSRDLTPYLSTDSRLEADGGAWRMTIGELARSVGVGVETIRFYERKGMIEEPPRRPSGYRQYGPEVIQRLRFIRRTKELGF
ncbi:MAG: MerR family transcriptional regulator, partial [Planctomycetota bacterium]